MSTQLGPSGLIPLLLLFLLPLILAPGTSLAATVVGYTEKKVWGLIRNMPRGNLTAQCSTSLDRVETYLTDRSTLNEQRRFYYQSFCTGDATQFISRDQDRWLFNAFKYAIAKCNVP